MPCRSRMTRLRDSILGVSGATKEMTESNRRALELELERTRGRAMFMEAGVLVSPEYTAASNEKLAAQRRRDGLLAKRAAITEGAKGAANQDYANYMLAANANEIKEANAEIDAADRKMKSLLNGVDMLNDAAKETEEALAGWTEEVKKTETEVAKTGDVLIDKSNEFEEAMKSATESWVEGFMDGAKDVGDLLDDLGRTALKYFASAGTSAFGGAFPFASGGHMPRDGLALVGEGGPELLALPGGSRIYNNRESRRMMGGGGNASIDINVHAGRDWDALAQSVRSQLDAAVPEIVGMAYSKVSDDAGRASPLNSRIRGGI